MDKTNRAIKITRRMTEIEELRANGDLTVQQDEALSCEYYQLEEELENLEVANSPPSFPYKERESASTFEEAQEMAFHEQLP